MKPLRAGNTQFANGMASKKPPRLEVVFLERLLAKTLFA